MRPAPQEVLAAARAAVTSDNYSEALEQYEYFFDHALDDDPSYYGVRLSYCLDEWARLGKRYPIALEHLEQKADAAIVALVQTRESARFHDYVSICTYLEQEGKPVEKFLYFHASDRELAESVVQYIWSELVAAKLWAVCIAYLPVPKDEYAKALMRFDEVSAMCKEDPSFGGPGFQEQVDGWIVRDVSNLLRVLLGSGSLDDATLLQSLAKSDMDARGRNLLMDRILDEIKD